mmetsp:Transcript_57967/g.114085  ORF Transcript_57967/g.114085 Transcript_57967/m.114085 type:complete len:222 (+) Transcript_57967:1501-2166(+)
MSDSSIGTSFKPSKTSPHHCENSIMLARPSLSASAAMNASLKAVARIELTASLGALSDGEIFFKYSMNCSLFKDITSFSTQWSLKARSKYSRVVCFFANNDSESCPIMFTMRSLKRRSVTVLYIPKRCTAIRMCSRRSTMSAHTSRALSSICSLSPIPSISGTAQLSRNCHKLGDMICSWLRGTANASSTSRPRRLFPTPSGIVMIWRTVGDSWACELSVW